MQSVNKEKINKYIMDMCKSLDKDYLINDIFENIKVEVKIMKCMMVSNHHVKNVTFFIFKLIEKCECLDSNDMYVYW